MTAGTAYPLRALSQDELFSAAFAVIRHAPRAALGLPFLAGVLNFAASLLVLTFFGTDSFTRLLTDPAAFDDAELAWAAIGDGRVMLLMTISTLLGSLLMSVSLGLLVIPTLRAAYGLPTTLRQTVLLRARQLGWLLLHLVIMGLLLSIIGFIAVVIGAILAGLTLFVGLIVIVPGLYLLLCWLTVAFMYGPVVIVSERLNAFAAIGRSFSLNRGMWWRNIAVIALFYLIVGIAIMLASMPAALASGLGGEIAWQSAEDSGESLGLLVLAAGHLYDNVLSALMMALAGALAAVMYLNCRIRQEALDVALLHAGQTQSDDDAATVLPGSPEHLARFFAPRNLDPRYFASPSAAPGAAPGGSR
ncbi:hypothetical protein [Nesterenkonia massiliensis]|uniref:hypothetical protein n=1 Tax=Nesterenkonia massiliensis TaxID=1232429 RepID=UPI0004098C95|nr:hypothetical protein [Nesterenkonia massiliensis]